MNLAGKSDFQFLFSFRTGEANYTAITVSLTGAESCEISI